MIGLFTQKEKQPNKIRDRKKAEPLGKGWMRGWADTEPAGEGENRKQSANLGRNE